MPINVDDIVTDAQLDEFMGGQVNGGITLLPTQWTDSLPARQHALDALLRYFRDATPTITEDLVTDPASLDEAIRCGAAARLYELALMRSPDNSGWAHLLKTYTARFEREMRKQIDIHHRTMTPDRKGRGRRSIGIERR